MERAGPDWSQVWCRGTFHAVLPEVVLDDVRFQELVNEARTRIVRHSPDWTDHNVSDPGITLIELFAWFTEILTYRTNRIPERLHRALLAFVGVVPGEPRQAAVELRFLLERPGGVPVPAGTEVTTPRAADAEPVSFQTLDELVIPAVESTRAAPASAPVASSRCRSAPRHCGAVREPAGARDALLLGFDASDGRSRHRARDRRLARRGGRPRPVAPPLVWEASGVDGGWVTATLISDETGGFLAGGGAITVDVPAAAGPATIAGRELHWLRCRVAARTAAGARAAYSRGPELSAVSAAVVGATVPAIHAESIAEELIGTSDGIPGSSYQLQHRPVLALGEGETLEVRERGADAWVAWQSVDSFAQSGAADHHFLLDRGSGEIRFGPAIRQPDGGWRRYGAVPAAGAWMRMRRYRHGGGRAGNVAPRTLSVMAAPVAGVASVTNPRAAAGGVDGQSLENARESARLAVRARTRAVTAEDFERLTLAASPQVARAVCVTPGEGRPIRVHVLPHVSPADRRLEFEELTPSPELMASLAAALDERRLIGTSIRLLPVRLRGVSVVVDVRASPLADLERVQQDVEHALYVYLNPVIGGSPLGPADGWPLGRALNLGELFGIVYGIAGVEFVNILRVYETDVRTGAQAPQAAESHLVIEPDELIASGRHIVKAVHRE